MERNKTPGLDGLPAEFYKKIWDVIKTDLMKMFSHLHARHLNLYRINICEITLLPKTNEAEWIQQ
jgi:hypothetical protein